MVNIHPLVRPIAIHNVLLPTSWNTSVAFKVAQKSTLIFTVLRQEACRKDGQCLIYATNLEHFCGICEAADVTESEHGHHFPPRHHGIYVALPSDVLCNHFGAYKPRKMCALQWKDDDKGKTTANERRTTDGRVYSEGTGLYMVDGKFSIITYCCLEAHEYSDTVCGRDCTAAVCDLICAVHVHFPLCV